MDAAPELMSTLPFSLATSRTASAATEPLMSKMASTSCVSYHLRAVAEAMSALFWWSAETSSTGLPLMGLPKSSMAIFAASTEPEPARSE